MGAESARVVYTFRIVECMRFNRTGSHDERSSRRGLFVLVSSPACREFIACALPIAFLRLPLRTVSESRTAFSSR